MIRNIKKPLFFKERIKNHNTTVSDSDWFADLKRSLDENTKVFTSNDYETALEELRDVCKNLSVLSEIAGSYKSLQLVDFVPLLSIASSELIRCLNQFADIGTIIYQLKKPFEKEIDNHTASKKIGALMKERG